MNIKDTNARKGNQMLLASTEKHYNTNTMTLRNSDTKTQGHSEIHRHKEAHKQCVQYGGHVHWWSIVLKRTLGHKKHLLRETKQERTYCAKRGMENQSWLTDTVYIHWQCPCRVTRNSYPHADRTKKQAKES